MKIAVSAMNADLDAQVDPRFGRCQYFIIVDSDTLEYESIENPNIGVVGGAGIQSGQLISEKGAQVILTGNVGPNAFQALSAAGLQIITGVTGTVKSAIQRFSSGQLQPISGATVPDHFGMGGGFPGAGRGMGMGRGMRGGMGRGRRNTMGPGVQTISAPQADLSAQQMTAEQELQMLKDQAEAMKHQLDQITSKIEDLDEK
ncbi:NifB/NifX family molybdenum-iron cluster-binding protein [Candidatus Poribacteria bacterium]